MTPERFDDLCLRALAGREAAARAQVEELTAKDPALAEQWRELQSIWGEIGNVVADTSAIKANESPAIPAERLAKLMQPAKAAEQTARTRSRRVRWLGGLGLATAVCVVALVVLKGPAPSRLALDIARVPARVQQNFFSPALAQLSAGTQLVTWRSTVRPAIISPRVATGWAQPVLAWENSANATYDVVLRETGGAVLLTLKAVRSPIALSAVTPTIKLTADKNYELQVTPAAGTAENTARARFVTTPALTLPAAETSQATLNALLAAMQSDPVRLGDALTLWGTLPRDWRASELGVRTGFWLAGEAQLPGLLADVQADAEMLNKQ